MLRSTWLSTDLCGNTLNIIDKCFAAGLIIYLSAKRNIETTANAELRSGVMGNQITAIAPAQILPLESYFSDLFDYGKPIR